MEKTIVEIGMLLDNEKGIEYYNDIIVKAGGVNVFNCETHDLYWTNKSHNELEKLTENEIKMSCVRFRMTSGFGGSCFSNDFSMKFRFENFSIYDDEKEDKFDCTIEEFKEIQEKMESDGWYLIFDTFKVDYQYKFDGMQSAIQIQEIDNIGLVLYYDNPDYYDMDEEYQREMLLNELNEYGFSFDKGGLGLDKLRTLLTGTSQFSKNQNG